MTIYDILDKHQTSLNKGQIRDLIAYEIFRCNTVPGITLFDFAKVLLLRQKFEDKWAEEHAKKEDLLDVIKTLRKKEPLDLSYKSEIGLELVPEKHEHKPKKK